MVRVAAIRVRKQGLERLEHPKLRKIAYWKFHGRALPLRLAAILGKIAYEDVFIADWKEHKPLSVAGTLPYVVFPDGSRTLGKSNAILTYFGRLSNLYPTDDLYLSSRVDEALDSIEDIYHLFAPTFREDDATKRLGMRQALLDGPLTEALSFMNKRADERFLVSDSMTVADLKLFGLIHMLRSGRLDGIPTDVTKKYLRLENSFANVDALQDVKAHLATF